MGFACQEYFPCGKLILLTNAYLFFELEIFCSQSLQYLFVYPNQWAWLNSHSYPTLNQNYNLVLKSLRNRPTKKWPWWGSDVLANDAPYSERDGFFTSLQAKRPLKKAVLHLSSKYLVLQWFAIDFMKYIFCHSK